MPHDPLPEAWFFASFMTVHAVNLGEMNPKHFV